MKPNATEFCPNWGSSPGETISDVLNERGMTITEFAEQIGQTIEQTSELLSGRSTITIGLARELGAVIGGSVEFWMSRDFQYREDVARIHLHDQAWLRNLPLGDMVKYGWISPVPHPSKEIEACLKFFDVPSIAVWHEEYRNVETSVAFRTTPSFESRPASVAAWLRQGEIEASRLETKAWNKALFLDSIPEIRRLTVQELPSIFLPSLQKLCSACGVATVVVRAPNGCRASGATRFVTAEKALLQLSVRYLSDDQFWFTFFHEAGHLLLHDPNLFLEGLETRSTREETEANLFAEEVLVPRILKQDLLSIVPEVRPILRFAKRIGISPGIVVGQLQHHGVVSRNHFNNLKQRYSWDNI